MHSKRLHFDIKIFDSKTELNASDRKLIREAKDAILKAYAIYSQFMVGAAALLEDGTILSSGNQENASYPLCLCAEQTLTGAIRSHDPNAVIKTIAITGFSLDERYLPPLAPCGGCRQILLEWELRQESPIRLLLKGTEDRVVMIGSCKDLLPLAFDGRYLPGQPLSKEPEMPLDDEGPDDSGGDSGIE